MGRNPPSCDVCLCTSPIFGPGMTCCDWAYMPPSVAPMVHPHMAPEGPPTAKPTTAPTAPRTGPAKSVIGPPRTVDLFDARQQPASQRHLDHAGPIARMDDGQAAMRVIANDADVRRLTLAPAEQRDVARHPVAGDGFAEMLPQPLPQLIIPRLAPVSARHVQRPRPAGSLHRHDYQPDAIHRPRLAALMPPPHADHGPGMRDHTFRPGHRSSCAGTSPAHPPPPGRLPPGTEPATPSPTGIVHSPLKLGQLPQWSQPSGPVLSFVQSGRWRYVSPTWIGNGVVSASVIVFPFTDSTAYRRPTFGPDVNSTRP